MARIRLPLLALVLSLVLSACDAGSITATEDCPPKYPTMGSGC